MPNNSSTPKSSNVALTPEVQRAIDSAVQDALRAVGIFPAAPTTTKRPAKDSPTHSRDLLYKRLQIAKRELARLSVSVPEAPDVSPDPEVVVLTNRIQYLSSELEAFELQETAS